MFKKFTNACVRVVNRWSPDPFLFAIILTIIVFIGGMLGTKQGPIQMLSAWGNDAGIWDCSLSPCRWHWFWCWVPQWPPHPSAKKGLGMIARTATTKMRAILIVTFVSTICCWLNWGFGLIAVRLPPRKSRSMQRRGLSVADCVRLLRLCHLARGCFPAPFSAAARFWKKEPRF